MTTRGEVEGAYLLMADGAARGNPGPAAYGFVLVAPDGQAVAEEGAVLGRATNNVAEYEGLLAGMERALALGVRRLAVKLDSELVVRQMSGQYRVKNAGLKPLFARAQGLRERFDAVTFEHVRREANRRADELANRALDAEEGGRVGSQSGDRGGS